MVKVCIEVEAGSCEKNLYDEKTLEYKGTRRISRLYPYPYGFIIGTRAADGDNVDCYLITHERLRAGTIVECEPIGLLEQDEDGEVDHKVLAALPGQDVEVGPGLQQELRDFIVAVFAQLPDVCVRVGRMLPREAALQHIQACRAAEEENRWTLAQIGVTARTTKTTAQRASPKKAATRAAKKAERRKHNSGDENPVRSKAA